MPAQNPPLLPKVDHAIDHAIDITARLCPMTFVHTRLALDRLDPGQVLQVRLKGAEPKANVPRSAAELGHIIIAIVDQADGTTLLTIRKR